MTIQDITIVVTSFKSENKIRNCLNSIDMRCQVINVENSDNREQKENIEKEFKNVQCILSGGNVGYGTGNNIGLKKVKTKYALILNPDVELFPDTIDNFLKMAEKVSNFTMIVPATLEDKKNLKSYSLADKSELFDHPIVIDRRVIKTVKGHAMFLNIHQFQGISFFDENIFFFLEETDLALRLLKNNKKIYYCAPIKVYHEGGRSHESNIDHEMELSRNWHWMWSTFYFNKKHYGFIFALFVVFPKLFSSFLKFIIFYIFKSHHKKEIYKQRFFGLLNSILGKKSWYRPKV